MSKEKPTYVCIREKQVNKHEADIVELKTRADYKEEIIHELKKDMEKMDKKLDNINECLNKLQRQSDLGDFDIDNRVTKLENTQNVLKWVTGIGLTAISTAITALVFFLTYIH